MIGIFNLSQTITNAHIIIIIIIEKLKYFLNGNLIGLGLSKSKAYSEVSVNDLTLK